MKILISVLMLLGSTCAYSAGTVTGNIISIQARESGYIEITFDADHDNPDGCQQKRKVVVAPNHVAKSEIVSFALAAMAQGSRSSFYASNCYSQYSTTYPIAITGAILK
ncbi:MAG: hypothetical protein K6L81_09045 [Agarilytica sp.]